LRTVAPKPVGRSRHSSQARIITTADLEFGCAPLVASGFTTVSGSWPSANDPVAVPFTINEAIVVTHLGWRNGSGAGSNHDIGIYDLAWNRLVSAGSSGAGTSSLWNFIDVTDTAIPAGRYYLVKVIDTTTANRMRYWNTPSSLVVTTMCGLKESATNQFPLPSSLADMTDPITQTRVPILGMCTRTPLA